jgi:hypothetical protein
MSGLKLGPLIKAFQDDRLIITPRLNMWLLQHGDDGYSEATVAKIAEQLRSKPRIRHSSFSSSGAGACLRAQVLSFLGVVGEGAIDPQLANIFQDGKWRHLRLQAAMLEAGIIDEIEYVLSWPKLRSRGTADGAGVVPMDHPMQRWRGKSFGVEVKGVSTFQFSKYEGADPNAKHEAQVDRYFLASGFDLFVFLYEDKTTQRMLEWVVEPDARKIAAARAELVELNTAVDTKTLPSMLPGCQMRNGIEWTHCSFAGKHGACPRAGSWPSKELITADGKVTY